MENQHGDNIAKEIGYLSLQFTYFDLLLNEINSSLINYSNKEIGNLISGDLKTDGRCQLFKKLLKIIPIKAEFASKADLNLSKFYVLKVKRNKFLHGIIHTKEENGDDSKDIYLTTIKEWGLGRSTKIELKELKSIRGDLRKLIKRQVDINTEVLGNYKEIINEKEKNKKELNRKIKKLYKNEEF